MGDAVGYGDLYDVKVDEAARTFTFTFNPTMNATKQAKPGLGVVVLTYLRIDDAHFKLDGVVGSDHLSVVVSRMDPGKSLLVSRGFHWINETPFNR
jgi:hypothetical protein